MLTTQSVFDRYQEVRSRFPALTGRVETAEITSLLDITDSIDAFVFDAFGVLNVGETLIPGADRRLDELRERRSDRLGFSVGERLSGLRRRFECEVCCSLNFAVRYRWA